MTDSNNGRKARVYLDHNILDLHRKGVAPDLFNKLKSNFQIIYSDETLKEIRRSKEGAAQFLATLEELDACHIKFFMTENAPTGDAYLTQLNPQEAYKGFCDNDGEFGHVSDSMQQLLLKFFGGRKGETIAEVNMEQRKSFEMLMEQMECLIKEVSEEMPGLSDEFEQVSAIMRAQHREVMDDFEKTMAQHVKDERNWSATLDYRTAMGVGPIDLNNIQPPNVIQKIWDKFKDKPPFDTLNFTIDDFIGLSGSHTKPPRPLFVHEKVATIYNFLNIIGYYPDNKLDNSGRFTASMSDQQHASIAVFADCLLSCDKNFVRKARAAYEYLGLHTQVIQLHYTP